MPTRRDVLKQGIGLATALPHVKFAKAILGPAGSGIVSKEDLSFLRGLALATIESATKHESKEGLGFTIVTPGGNYPAFWVRDFSMAVGTGLISTQSILNHLRLIVQAQNGTEERRLTSGGIVPPFAVPDHVNYDGSAVFFPGTYSPGEDQGGEPWGILPPIDDHYEFVHIAHQAWKQDRDVSFLRETTNKGTVFDRLVRAVESPSVDRETGLVVTTDARRAVGFGFCDSVYLTGSLLFASLLRYRALGELAELAKAIKSPGKWSRDRGLIKKSLARTFATQDGWLLAATGTGRQPDVWGTAYAVHLGVLQGQEKVRAVDALVKATVDGTITYQGAVRHVPTDKDSSSTSAWEKTAGVSLNTYQNGAYWHVPTGWLVSAVLRADRNLAVKIASEMVSSFRNEDFRLGGGNGAPWECLHSNGGYRNNPVYMASVTLPLEVLTSLDR